MKAQIKGKPVFMNGYWRAVSYGVIQPHCYTTWVEAERNCL